MWPSIVDTSSLHTFFPKGATGKQTFRLAKNKVVFAQGDPNNSIFFIEKGIVKLTVVSRVGKEAIFSVLGEGCFFGEACIASKETVRSYNAIVVSDAVLSRIERDIFSRHLQSASNSGYAFTEYLVKLNEAVQDHLVHNLLETSERRLAQALLSLAKFDKENEEYVVRVSQQNLADMIGATRQRVNTLLRGFKRAGLVQSGHDLRVNTSLRKFAGQQ